MVKRHTFRPRARLLQLLGDQLIGDPRVAVFELVKNAYDADSPHAAVTFHDVEHHKKATIVISDDGEGMDMATVTKIWLEPGADHREKQRLAGIRTKKFHRLPLGEKGVGRFACHKLGNKIDMVTRSGRAKEIVVSIDWDKLIAHRYLTDAVVSIQSRSPVVFKGESTGTRITISRLRHRWTRGDVRKLYRSINAIARPFDGDQSFSVAFKMEPDLGWTDALMDPADIEAQAMFLFDFTLSGTEFEFTYEFKPLDDLLVKAQRKKLKTFEPRELTKQRRLLEYFVMETDEHGKKRKRSVQADLNKFGIGTIRGRLLGFDRDKDVLALYVDQKGLTEFLDNNGGVRVYRDGIRVYNYGEPGTDWLGLDERRVQIPKRRISNNLVLGEVNLDLEKSTKLIEKTNREGFVENAAYEEFRKAVLGAVIAFEQERAIDKDKIRELLETPDTGEPFPSVHGPEEAIYALRGKISERGLNKELGPYVDKVETTYQEVRETLLHAVGTGLGLSIVFHEIERGVRDLSKAIETGTSRERTMALARHLVELLDGASYFVRTASKKSFKASDVVKHAIFSLGPRFEYHGIAVANIFESRSAQDFNISGSRQMVTASVVNLLDNAIYWLNLEWDRKSGGRSQQKRIRIGPSNDTREHAIVVADNGPGIEDSPEMVVKPFFTRKPDGMGLGLYFVNMTMQAHGGRLDFPQPSEQGLPQAYDGAVLSMIFKDQK